MKNQELRNLKIGDVIYQIGQMSSKPNFNECQIESIVWDHDENGEFVSFARAKGMKHRLTCGELICNWYVSKQDAIHGKIEDIDSEIESLSIDREIFEKWLKEDSSNE